MRALRKLVLGETWTLPIGVGLTLVAALAADALDGDAAWWRRGGGFLILVLVVSALAASLAPARRRHGAVGMRSNGSTRPVEDERRSPAGTAP
jgi:hypothetical protein